MKLFLALAATVAIVSSSSTAAAVLTVGGPLSKLCFQSAEAGDGRRSAVDACSRALEEQALRPADRAATLVNRGIVLMSSGRYSEADADFDAALTLQPDLSDGWLNKGLMRLREGEGARALPLIQRAMDMGVRNRALAIFARGVAHEQTRDYGPAYADIQQARKLAPRWSLPRVYLASYRTDNR